MSAKALDVYDADPHYVDNHRAYEWYDTLAEWLRHGGT